MAIDSKTGGSTPADFSRVAPSVADAFAQADETTGARARQLQSVYLARASRLARAADELRAEHGADAPEVRRADAALASARASSAQAAMLHQRFITADPAVAPEGWVLHGRVFDESRKPIAGHTVFFADAAKVYLQAYGFSSTDETGYFLLRYDGGRPAPYEPATQDSEARGTELFVEVADRKGRLVYRSDRAFRPIVGAAAYEDIVLTESGASKGEPPAQVRKTSLPKRTPKR
jgi:hypothetical protein